MELSAFGFSVLTFVLVADFVVVLAGAGLASGKSGTRIFCPTFNANGAERPFITAKSFTGISYLRDKEYNVSPRATVIVFNGTRTSFVLSVAVFFSTGFCSTGFITGLVSGCFMGSDFFSGRAGFGSALGFSIILTGSGSDFNFKTWPIFIVSGDFKLFTRANSAIVVLLSRAMEYSVSPRRTTTVPGAACAGTCNSSSLYSGISNISSGSGSAADSTFGSDFTTGASGAVSVFTAGTDGSTGSVSFAVVSGSGFNM